MLDLEHLPQTASFEMLEACRDRIFALEAVQVTELATPARARPERPERSSASKALSSAKIEKEKKSLVKEIKKKLTPVKFHQGFDKVSREVKFAAERFPTEVAELILGAPCDPKAAGTVSKTFRAKEAEQALSLAPGDLQGAVWQKGGAQIGRRFGATKARRLGNATLLIESLTLSYTVKSQRISGSLVCVNDGTSRKRGRGESDGEDSDAELPFLGFF